MKGHILNSTIFLEQVRLTHLSGREIQEWVEILRILLSEQSLVPLAEKTVTTTLISEVLASCWACSAHSHGSGIGWSPSRAWQSV